MEAEPAAAAPAETAPAVEVAAPAAEVATAAPVTAAPMREAPVAAEVAQAEAAVDASPEEMRTAPTYDTFGWDDWNGDVEGLPEDARGWYGKFDERHKAVLASEQTRYSELDKLFNAYLQSGDDPRIADLTNKFNTLTDEHDSVQVLYRQAQLEIAARNEREEKDAEAWSDQFLAQNKEFLDKSDHRKQFIAALDTGWEPSDALVLLQMPEEARKEASAALAEGTPSSRALKFGQLTAAQKSVLPPPRDAASVVAGAEGGPARPHRSQRSLNDGASLKDMRGLVARNALRKHGKAGG